MKFTCDSCGAQYMISDDKVGPSGVKVRCKKCGNVVLVRRTAEVAAAAEAPAPVIYFHLAQAHALAGRRKDAAQAWKKAHALGLSPRDLHPLERAAYDRLAAQKLN